MFNIGDVVIYSAHGISKIDNICEKTFSNVTKTYYELLPLFFIYVSLYFSAVQQRNNTLGYKLRKKLAYYGEFLRFYYWVTMYSASCSLICLPIRLDCSVASSIQATNEAPT